MSQFLKRIEKFFSLYFIQISSHIQRTYFQSNKLNMLTFLHFKKYQYQVSVNFDDGIRCNKAELIISLVPTTPRVLSHRGRCQSSRRLDCVDVITSIRMFPELSTTTSVQDKRRTQECDKSQTPTHVYAYQSDSAHVYSHQDNSALVYIRAPE